MSTRKGNPAKVRPFMSLSFSFQGEITMYILLPLQKVRFDESVGADSPLPPTSSTFGVSTGSSNVASVELSTLGSTLHDTSNAKHLLDDALATYVQERSLLGTLNDQPPVSFDLIHQVCFCRMNVFFVVASVTHFCAVPFRFRGLLCSVAWCTRRLR